MPRFCRDSARSLLLLPLGRRGGTSLRLPKGSLMSGFEKPSRGQTASACHCVRRRPFNSLGRRRSSRRGAHELVVVHAEKGYRARRSDQTDDVRMRLRRMLRQCPCPVSGKTPECPCGRSSAPTAGERSLYRWWLIFRLPSGMAFARMTMKSAWSRKVARVKSSAAWYRRRTTAASDGSAVRKGRCSPCASCRATFRTASRSARATASAARGSPSVQMSGIAHDETKNLE